MQNNADIELSKRIAGALEQVQKLALELDGTHMTTVQAMAVLKGGWSTAGVHAPKAMAALKASESSGVHAPKAMAALKASESSGGPSYYMSALGLNGHSVRLPDSYRPGDGFPGLA